MTKANPKRRIAGIDSTTSAPTMPTITRTKSPTHEYTVPWKIRSPQRMPRGVIKKARGRGTPSATPPRPALPSIISGRCHERLPFEGQLLHLGLDLLDDGCRQRRVEQIRRVFLPIVNGPPQELRQELALGLIRLILVDQEPGEARDRVGRVTRRVGQRHTKVGGHAVRRPGGRCRGRGNRR